VTPADAVPHGRKDGEGPHWPTQRDGEGRRLCGSTRTMASTWVDGDNTVADFSSVTRGAEERLEWRWMGQATPVSWTRPLRGVVDDRLRWRSAETCARGGEEQSKTAIDARRGMAALRCGSPAWRTSSE
jgi:hypothetical protein